MSKRTYHRRVMPKTGRMVNGSFKSDYDQGYDDALTGGYGNRQAPHEHSLIPLHIPARSREYWLGVRAGRIHTGELDPTLRRADVNKIRKASARLLREAQALAEHRLGSESYRDCLRRGISTETILKMAGVDGLYKAAVQTRKGHGKVTARA